MRSLYSGLSLFFKRFRSFFVEANGGFCWFMKCKKFLVETRQSGFISLYYAPNKQSEMQSILSNFGKKRVGKRFGTKIDIVLKWSISTPSGDSPVHLTGFYLTVMMVKYIPMSCKAKLEMIHVSTWRSCTKMAQRNPGVL